MPSTGSPPATDLARIDDFDGGVGWIAYPDEGMARASHALVVDSEVWVIDPVDAEGVDALLADRGDVAGVVVLLDRHRRDADAVARRHDVPIYLPRPVHGIAADFTAPVERFRHDLADTGYGAHPIVDRLGWREAALYGEETDVLVVPEAVGTAEHFRVGDERLGVHPVLRLRPPRSLSQLTPERVLVGHGEGVHEASAEALDHAIAGSRRRMPALYWQTLKRFVAG